MTSMTAMAALSAKERLAEAGTSNRGRLAKATDGALTLPGPEAAAGGGVLNPLGRAGANDAAGVEKSATGASADVAGASGGALVSAGATGAAGTWREPELGFSKVMSKVGGDGGGAGSGAGGGAAIGDGATTTLRSWPVTKPERSNVTCLPSVLRAPSARTPAGSNAGLLVHACAG